ncbi:MAG: TetR/AcrR family transcriptional regulator [Spirochaetota bacterium]|nr:TetR/AcrR family transcriptional regulator [Spirochaetota bacterium]
MLAKGQRRKHQIIDTAKDMFMKIGFQSTHIGKVCEELNIARGTVYQYFGNKREILYAILESVEEKIDDILDLDDLKDFLKTNPSQKLVLKFVKERILGTIRSIENEPIIIKLIFKDIVGIDGEILARVNAFIELITKSLIRDIEEIIKKGLYKKSIDSELTSLMFIGGVLFILYNDNKTNSGMLEEYKIDAIVNNYFNGVLK